jgi:membrane-associated phospholipid phosphatase
MHRRKQPVTRGLLVSMTALGLFAGIAASVKPTEALPRDNLLTEFDRGLDQRLHELNGQSPTEVTIFRHITDLGSSKWILRLALVVTVLLVLIPVFRLRRERRVMEALARGSLIALAWMLVLLGGEWFNQGLKDYIKRDRPPFHEAIHASGYSFPSGHTMGSLIAYGMLAYLLVLSIPTKRLRITVVGLLAGLVLLIGFSRMFLGAHWFSDVVGGFAAGGFWLALSISAIEMVRRRRLPAPIEQPAPVTLEAEIESAAERVAS